MMTQDSTNKVEDLNLFKGKQRSVVHVKTLVSRKPADDSVRVQHSRDTSSEKTQKR